MTLQTLGTPVNYPGLGDRVAGIVLSTRATLDAAGEYDAQIIAARESMTISHVIFKSGAVAGSPTAEIRIETVDTSGVPTGTLWATDTNVTTSTLTGSTMEGPFQLTASASITAGQVFALVIKYASGTSFITQYLTGQDMLSNLPYRYIFVGGAGTKGTGSYFLAALGSSATSFYSVHAMAPSLAVGGGSFNNTNGERRGARFTLPFKARCCGISLSVNNATGDFNAILMNDAGSELSSSSTAYDGNHTSATTNYMHNVFFDNPVTLSPGVYYRAVIEPSSATNTTFNTLTGASANYVGGFPGRGTYMYTSYASSVWTDSTTDVPLMDVLLDQLDDGVQPHVIGG